MIEEPYATKVWVHLYGGEQDGFRHKIELKTRAPKKFYMWRVNDLAEIDKAKGKQRMVVHNRLATMAYEHFETVHLDDCPEIRYRRLESADKVDRQRF